MNTLVSSFVKKVQSKHWDKLKKRTQKLDPVEQENLLEFLEDHLPSSNGTGSAVGIIESDSTAASTAAGVDGDFEGDSDCDSFVEDDYELLQCDLDRASIKLEALQSKRDFLQTRLQTYQEKIKAAEQRLHQNAEDNGTEQDGDPEFHNNRLMAMNEKIEGYKKSLKPIEDIYEGIEKELLSHQLKMESIQDRQLELKLKTEECRVVLHELSCNAGGLESGDVPEERHAETSQHIGLISNACNDNHSSRRCNDQVLPSEEENDVENARVEREECSENTEISIEDSAEESASVSLLVPIGEHSGIT